MIITHFANEHVDVNVNDNYTPIVRKYIYVQSLSGGEEQLGGLPHLLCSYQANKDANICTRELIVFYRCATTSVTILSIGDSFHKRLISQEEYYRVTLFHNNSDKMSKGWQGKMGEARQFIRSSSTNSLPSSGCLRT